MHNLDLVYDRVERSTCVLVEHTFQSEGYDFVCMAGRAKRFIAFQNDLLHGGLRVGQVFSRIEFSAIFFSQFLFIFLALFDGDQF